MMTKSFLTLDEYQKIFNIAPIALSKEDILSFTEGITFLVYSNKIKTKFGDYTIKLMGYKLQVYQLLDSYLS